MSSLDKPQVFLLLLLLEGQEGVFNKLPSCVVVERVDVFSIGDGLTSCGIFPLSLVLDDEAEQHVRIGQVKSLPLVNQPPLDFRVELEPQEPQLDGLMLVKSLVLDEQHPLYIVEMLILLQS